MEKNGHVKRSSESSDKSYTDIEDFDNQRSSDQNHRPLKKNKPRIRINKLNRRVSKSTQTEKKHKKSLTKGRETSHSNKKQSKHLKTLKESSFENSRPVSVGKESRKSGEKLANEDDSGDSFSEPSSSDLEQSDINLSPLSQHSDEEKSSDDSDLLED